MKTSLLLGLGLILSAASFAQAPRAPEGVRAERNLAYVENGHERHKLDLYLPEKKTDAPLPLIIWVHGGGWQNGSKENCPPLRSGYVERGYAVASLNYRLSQHAIFPAQIEDCKAAIRWLRAHAAQYGLDAQRFGVWGSSAGGHLVALLGTSGGVKDFDVGAHLDQSSRVQAVCDYFGPTDFVAFGKTPGYERHARLDAAEAKLLGGLVADKMDLARRVSPLTFVTRDDPAFLIVHGDQDPTVPLNQSELLFASLKKEGVSARLHTIRGAGHGGPGFAGQDIEELVAKFFDQRLKENSTAVEALTTESTADPAAPAPDPRAAGTRSLPWPAIVGRLDQDRDGKVSKAEFAGPAPLFERLDRDHDGFVTREEHEAATDRKPQ